MISKVFICQVCGQENQVGDIIGRRDSCSGCQTDLRSCCQCRHYDTAMANDCREPQVELVVDKERANFCDFYQPAAGSPAKGGGGLSKDEAAAKWEELFGKK